MFISCKIASQLNKLLWCNRLSKLDTHIQNSILIKKYFKWIPSLFAQPSDLWTNVYVKELHKVTVGSLNSLKLSTVTLRSAHSLFSTLRVFNTQCNDVICMPPYPTPFPFIWNSSCELWSSSSGPFSVVLAFSSCLFLPSVLCLGSLRCFCGNFILNLIPGEGRWRWIDTFKSALCCQDTALRDYNWSVSLLVKQALLQWGRL